MYADLNALLARAGRLAPAWSRDTDPDLADLERWLAECSATLDVELGAKGVGLPVDDEAVISMLGGIAADGALALALEATWPGPDAPADAAKLLEGARGRWEAALASIRDGTSAALGFLVVEGEGVESKSTSFWIAEPQYPLSAVPADVRNPTQAPGAYRGQRY